MSALELKVPPLLVALIVALAMGGIASFTPTLDIDRMLRAAVAIVVAAAGLAVGLAGILAFRRATTTVNPMTPGNASSLVTGGIYRVTRNPMYVGVAIVLVAWAVFLASPWALVGVLAFAAYLTRFQIVPEEKALASRFGDAYASYAARVRRWL
ncbi:MAG TPA: isoprenylcysteine carboxylmethyltransferase family protein [Casimicrobiaceae bacterium]|nr:isoprenylcysteine carboxylmethyltransferase family protein [Casimicrobiaceae bacterium]